MEAVIAKPVKMNSPILQKSLEFIWEKYFSNTLESPTFNPFMYDFQLLAVAW